MNRAYALLELKGMDEEAREIHGIASTPSTDRMGDIVEPRGAQFKLPIPLLWQHDAKQPIGHVTHAKVTPEGIEIRAKLAQVLEPGVLKDRLDEAWQSIKAQLVRGLSIGFKPTESERIKGGDGFRFTKWQWLELSPVTIAANADASILTIRSIDQELRASSGTKRSPVVRLASLPGASGTKTTKPGDTKVKNIAEQITAFEQERNTKAQAMSALMNKSGESGTTLDESQDEEYETLAGELKAIDKHLDRLRTHQSLVVEKATPVQGKTPQEGTVSRGFPNIVLNRTPEEKFQGQFQTQRIIAKALSYLDHVPQSFIAATRFKSNPMLVEVVKANEVQSGSSDTWGSELVSADNRFMGDFIDFLNAQTVYNRLNLREIPANVAVKGQDGAATGYWTGESKAIKLSAPSFSSVSLTPLKVGGLAVVSKELIRDSSPAAERLVRDALVEAIAQRIDATFLSATAASNGVSPAGILNGVTSIGSHGTDGDAVRNDIKALYAAFIAAKNASGLVLVMDKSQAKGISLMVNALGQTEFPGLTQDGGTLLGDPVVTGENVGTGDVILLKPSDIYKIGDGGLEVSMSGDATIEMSSAPAGAADVPTGGTENPVSMFQTDSLAIKVVRSINFAKRRAGVVQYIRDAAYGDPGSTG